MRFPAHFFIAMIVLSACASTYAGSVGTALEHAEVFLGESTRYQITYENLKGADQPDLKYLENDFKVEFVDSSTSEQMTVVGSQITRVSNIIYLYRIAPRRIGRIVVPGPTVNANGLNQKGADQVLNVVEPEKQDVVMAQIVASKSTVYPTQEFDVTLRVYVRPLPDEANRDPVIVLRNSPTLLINWLKEPEGLHSIGIKEWLEPLLSNSGRGFAFDRSGGVNIVELFNLSTGMEPREDLSGKKRDYHVYELKRRFRADKPGTYSFGPAVIKGDFVEGLAQRRYTLKRLRVTAPELTVNVVPVPADRPAGFSGAIGEYKLTSSATPSKLRVGDPLTLSVTMERGSGAGMLDLVAAPDLTANEKLAADFEIVDKNPTGEVNGNTKKFSYSMRPKRPGVSIPELSASIFDPAKEKFVEITAPPIPLNVTEATALNASEIVGTLGKRNGQDLRSAENGIFQNISDIHEIKNQKTEPLSTGILVGLSWIGALAGCFVLSRRRSFASDTAWQRRDGARSTASRKLNDARGASPAHAARHVREAVVGIVADLRNKPAAGFTPSDALREMSGTPVELQNKTRELLESLEAVEYAPQNAIDSAVYIRKAEDLLPELHRALEKSR